MTLREGRQRYFEANGFGADGGYARRWVPVKVLGVPIVIPNSDARRRAVRFHDLHHVLTGYATNFAGEAEIGAWELASGCTSHLAAWVLNMYGIYFGIAVAPRAMLRAWARGRHTRNLYSYEFGDALLSRPIADVQHELGLDAAPPAPGARDVAGFSAMWLLAFAAHAAPLVALAIWLR